MSAFPHGIDPFIIPALMPTYDREKSNQRLVVLHVDGLRPSGSYSLAIQEPDDKEEVFESTKSTLKIVSEEADETTLDRVARHVLKAALEVLEKCGNNTSLAFAAHDIGGSVVKQALVIASQEEEYRRVLEDTHLLIFSGVPHRPSPQGGWFSPLLSVVDSCFVGWKGPWMPKLLDLLATKHDAIANDFKTLASRFIIISFYEKDELVVTNRAKLSKHCATLGAPHENTIAVADQSQLMYKKPLVDQEMSHIIDTCLLSHRKDLTDFVRLLSFDDPPQFSDTFFHPTHVHVVQQLLSLPQAKSWLASNEGGISILRLATRDILDEDRLFDSLVTAVKLSKKHYHPSILRLSRHHQPAPRTEAGTLASLVKQILHQQPQLYPTVESLFPLVHDAASSRSATWKKRVLWRCLETLLWSPRTTDIFLFVALKDNDTCGIFPRILSAAAKTSMRLRIAVAISSPDRYPKNLKDVPTPPPIDFDLLSDVFETAHKQDNTNELPDIISSIILRDPSDHLVEATLFSRALESEGAWLPLAILWATGAARPLSVAELNILITLDIRSYTAVQSYESPLNSDRASLLPQLMPSMFEIVDGTVRVGRLRTIEHEAKTVFELRRGSTVNAHFADTCLVYLLDFLRRGPAFKAFVGQYKMSDEEDKDKEDGALEGDMRQRSQVEAMREAATSLAKYAAQHWITYLRRDGDASKFDKYHEFITSDGVVLAGWIKLLVQSSDISADKYVNEVDEVMQLLTSPSLPNLQVLEYVSYAYSSPSSAPIFDRLLVLAAELADEQFIKGLSEVASEMEKPFTAKDVARAIAAAPLSLTESLSRLPLRDGTILHDSDIYLRATQLANNPVAGAILLKIRSQASFSDEGLNDLLARALCIACEYGDSDTAAASPILSHDMPSELFTTNANIATALHIAVATCNADAALRLLDLGVPGEAYTSTGYTPLLLATQRGFTSLVRILVTERQADVHATDSSNRMALHFAAENGFEEIVRILLSSDDGKTSVNAHDDRRETPIVAAVWSAHEAVAKFLVNALLENPEVAQSHRSCSEGETDEEADEQEAEESGSSSDMKMEDGSIEAEKFAILHAATKNGIVEIVKMLVGEVTEQDVWNKTRHFTPLHSAALYGFADIVKLLCKHYPFLINAVNSKRCTALHVACYYGQKAVVDELLKHAPKLSLPDSKNRTPFAAACYVGALDVIASLLPALPLPADTDNTNIDDLSKHLNEAARLGHREVVEFLLDHGGSPNAVDVDGKAALSWAARNGDCRLIESLLRHHCTLDPTDKDGRTPLYNAMENDASDCVRLLVNEGADPDCKTNSGRTPLNEAVSRDKPVLVQLLLGGGAKLELSPYRLNDPNRDSLLKSALQSSSEELVRVLGGFYAKGRGEKTITPEAALGLALAINPDAIPALMESWPQTTQYLRKHGRFSDATNFHSIASKGNVETLKVILGFMDKRNINYSSGTSGTLLHAAICGGSNCIESKVRLLLDHDANPSIIGGRHGTTLNAAAYFHLQSVAKLLLERLPKGESRWQFMKVAGAEGTPIHAAVKGLENAKSAKAAVEFLDFLSSEDAPLGLPCYDDENLLHVAARVDTKWYSKDVVKWLLKKGFDRDEPDIAGRRPMHFAIHNGDIDLVKLLLTKNTTLDTLDHQKMNGLHYATLSKNWTMTSRLVDLYRGGDLEKDISSFIEAKDVDGWRPLHWACRRGHDKAVQYLMEDCKAIADARAETIKTGKWTPRQVALYHGNTWVASLLPEPPLHEQNKIPPDGALDRRVFCDSCTTKIFGDQYRCQDCYNSYTEPRTTFNLCWKCYANHSGWKRITLHNSHHDFEKING